MSIGITCGALVIIFQDWFIGHELRDKEPTIIHHFTSPDKLTFPDFAAGVFLSMPLINK